MRLSSDKGKCVDTAIIDYSNGYVSQKHLSDERIIIG